MTYSSTLCENTEPALAPGLSPTGEASSFAGCLLRVNPTMESLQQLSEQVDETPILMLNFLRFRPPGFLDNTGCNDPQILKKVLTTIPQGRLGETEECAHFAASMLDGESNFMSGEFLSLSGGWTAT